MYETFEHTADVGLRIQAADLALLFAEAGRGFLSVLVDNPADVQPRCNRSLRIAGSDKEYLLFDWLNELLYLFESESLLPADFVVEVGEEGLTATVRGEPADVERHFLAHEIKAITYHQLSVKQTADGWQATVILDI